MQNSNPQSKPGFTSFWKLGGLLLTVSLASALVTRAVPNNGHLATADCRNCHLATSITKENANMLASSEEDLCLKCHPNALKASHPTGFHPNRKLPANMPLDWKGDLTCSTCHDIHLPVGSGILRHNKRGQPFCLLCHDQAFFNRMMDGGTSMMASGHLDTRKTSQALELDAFTYQCIGCHTEMSGGNKVMLNELGVMRHNGSSMSHPLGGRYENFGPGQGYRFINQLPEQIMLPDGKIGCVTCHEGYSEIHGKLVISNKRSGLCLACHDL